MIDIDALKRDKRPQSAWVVHALIDHLEAAEKSDAESIAMYRRARDERDELRAKLEATEEDRSRFILEMGRPCAQCDALPQRSRLWRGRSLLVGAAPSFSLMADGKKRSAGKLRLKAIFGSETSSRSTPSQSKKEKRND